MTPSPRTGTGMPAIRMCAAMPTARPTALAIRLRSGWSVTMRPRRSAAARRKMTACASSGRRSRSSAQPHAISTRRTMTRKTGRRIPLPGMICWRTGMRRMRISSAWNIAIGWRRKPPGPAIFFTESTRMMRRLRPWFWFPPRRRGMPRQEGAGGLHRLLSSQLSLSAGRSRSA